MVQTKFSIDFPILKRKVSQYTKPVSTLKEQVMMPQACKVLQKQKTHEVIVVDDLGHPVGIVTNADILKKIGEAYARAERTSLADIMSFPVVSIKHDASLEQALAIMKKKQN